MENKNEEALPASEPGDYNFTPKVLDRTVIAIPLLELMKKKGEEEIYDVIIDINLSYKGGRQEARVKVRKLIKELKNEMTSKKVFEVNNQLGVNDVKQI